MKLLYPLFLLENYFLTLLSAYLNFFPARKKKGKKYSVPPKRASSFSHRFSLPSSHAQSHTQHVPIWHGRGGERGIGTSVRARFSVFGGGRREIQLLSSEKRRRRRRPTYSLSLLLLCRDSHLFTEKTIYSYKC